MKNTSTVGIILAGGRGMRLSSIAPPYFKTLLEIDGLPVVGHAARAVAIHVDEIVVVTGTANLLQVTAAVSRCSNPMPKPVTPVLQKEPLGVAHAIKVALENIRGDHPLVVVCGDNIVESKDVKKVLDYVQGLEFPGVKMAWTYKEFDRITAKRFAVWSPLSPGHPDNVGRLIEKPGNPPGGICWCGPIAFRSSREVMKRIGGLSPSSRGEYEVTDLLNTYLMNGESMRIPLEGIWFDIGTPEALEEARYFMHAEMEVNR